jgi:hypothetical protein
MPLIPISGIEQGCGTKDLAWNIHTVRDGLTGSASVRMLHPFGGMLFRRLRVPQTFSSTDCTRLSTACNRPHLLGLEDFRKHVPESVVSIPSVMNASITSRVLAEER